MNNNDGIRAFEAMVNVTWNGQNGDLPDAISVDASDAEIKTFALEALRTGGIPGIAVDARANLDDFVVDRFAASEEVPYHRVFLRPKTPFGRR
jgi:hypothetical protein